VHKCGVTEGLVSGLRLKGDKLSALSARLEMLASSAMRVMSQILLDCNFFVPWTPESQNRSGCFVRVQLCVPRRQQYNRKHIAKAREGEALYTRNLWRSRANSGRRDDASQSIIQEYLRMYATFDEGVTKLITQSTHRR
jgi:hypothetical protein